MRETDFHYRKFYKDIKITADIPGSWHNISFSISTWKLMWTRLCPSTVLGSSEQWTAFSHCAGATARHLFQNSFRLLNHFHFNANISILRQWINCLELHFLTSVLCPFIFFFALNILHIEVAFSTLMTSSILVLHFLRHCCISYFDARCIFYLDDTFYLDVAFSTFITFSTSWCFSTLMAFSTLM